MQNPTLETRVLMNFKVRKANRTMKKSRTYKRKIYKMFTNVRNFYQFVVHNVESENEFPVLILANINA